MQPFHSVKFANQWLRQGNLLAYPTESVWGIGCDAYDEQAVHAILNIKNRPIDKGMIVVTDSIERIGILLDPLATERKQKIIDSWRVTEASADHFQSRQASTWLLPIPDSAYPIPVWITGKHNLVAVRVIAHPLIAQLCANLVSEQNPYGFLVSTSCNPAGDIPAKTLEEAMVYFADGHSDNSFSKQVGFLQGDTLGYTLPSQIQDSLTGRVVR